MSEILDGEWRARVKAGTLFANDKQPYFDPQLGERLTHLRRVPPAGFAVPAHVWALVDALPSGIETRGDQEHATCLQCDQSYAVMARAGVLYEYADGELDGLLLAHLIQAHHWTREGPPMLEAGHG